MTAEEYRLRVALADVSNTMLPLMHTEIEQVVEKHVRHIKLHIVKSLRKETGQ